MSRLNETSCFTVRSKALTPEYDRKGPPGVVHLGVGAFHRAHQAAYLDGLMRAGETGWMISGASLRSAGVRDQLAPQDGLYTLNIMDGDACELEVIGSISKVLVAPDDPAGLVAEMTRPEVALVTLTVTEKGYCLDPATGELSMDDPGIQHDISNLDTPRTAPGFLVAGLSKRRQAGIEPFTVLSCDNLPDNGARTRKAVIALALAIDPDLAAWIEHNGAFPSSMVDRIVPATTKEDINSLESALGVRDEGMVKTEPFTQWVVEEWFCNRRPPLEKVGVQMTDNVAAWEAAKLRMLNGSHSALAYLGGLAGHAHVHEAVAAPEYKAFIENLWDEIAPTLTPVEGFDVASYRSALMKRYSNAALKHRTYQIAMDGSQKLPQRLLNTIRDCLVAGNTPQALTAAVAGWIRWQSAVYDNGTPFVVDDPLAAETHRIVEEHQFDDEKLVQGILALTEIFGDDLPNQTDWVNLLVHQLSMLRTKGAAALVSSLSA